MSRSLATKCLPLDFMGLFVLSGLETDKRVRNKAKNYMVFDINKRKDYVKNIMLTGSGTNILLRKEKSHSTKELLAFFSLSLPLSLKLWIASRSNWTAFCPTTCWSSPSPYWPVCRNSRGQMTWKPSRDCRTPFGKWLLATGLMRCGKLICDFLSFAGSSWSRL